MAERIHDQIPTQRPHFGSEEICAIREVLDSRWTGRGGYVDQFETEIKNRVGVEHVIAVQSGTAALHLALEACIELGVAKPGDEVLVPTQTFAATPQAIINAGLTPVFCDIERSTLNLDPDDAKKRITPDTKIILPVHYRGEPCNMDEILAIAQEYNLWTIEDAAHAFGSTYHGKPVGSLGHITCFSFDHIKNVTAIEGGAVATNIKKVADILGPMSNLGFKDGKVRGPGFRYHMPNLNAAIALTQLSRFEKQYIPARRHMAARYQKELNNLPGIKLLDLNLEETVPFFYVVLAENKERDKLKTYLDERGIQTIVRYDLNHLQPYFIERFGEVSLPVAERTFGQILALPLFVEMTDAQQSRVIEAIKGFCYSEAYGRR